MLGVRREGVTVAAGRLQDAGAISYVRGRINILDRLKMEETVCECYRVVKNEFDRVAGISLLVLLSIADRYALKTHLALRILPRNLQCIRVSLARYEFESFQLIVISVSRFSINPGSVR
jgi:hypothetical protein